MAERTRTVDRKGSAFDRVVRRVHMEPMTGCWLWTGYLSESGYGRINYQGRNRMVHRVTHEHANGPVPDGMQVDHLCNQRCCANPDHLRAVTPRENTMRSTAASVVNAAKTHCVNGHPLSGENLIRVPATPRHGPQRRCRTCTNEAHRRCHGRQR